MDAHPTLPHSRLLDAGQYGKSAPLYCANLQYKPANTNSLIASTALTLEVPNEFPYISLIHPWPYKLPAMITAYFPPFGSYLIACTDTGAINILALTSDAPKE